MNNPEEFNVPARFRAKYLLKASPDGLVGLADFERGDLSNQRAENVASLLSSDVGADLVKKLRYQGGSGKLSDMKIHIDDIGTFVERVKKYYESKK